MSGRIEVAGIAVVRDVVSHPLLGDAHIIEHAGRALTALSAIDWDHPTTIPAIAEPGALPAHAGGALMNELAVRAAAAGVRALRYAGPYPTPALYRTLLRSFRASADEAVFTKDLLARAASLSREEVAVNFTPAPHVRIVHAHGHVELRDGIERAVIDGVAYERDASIARLAGDHAEVWFGDALWARVASFDDRGGLVDGPHPIPPAATDVVGKPFPPALLHALAGLVRDLVPLGLPVELPAVRWANLGARAARVAPSGGDGYEVHAALWERLAPHGMARLALALAEALAPVVTMKLVQQLGRP